MWTFYYPVSQQLWVICTVTLQALWPQDNDWNPHSYSSRTLPTAITATTFATFFTGISLQYSVKKLPPLVLACCNIRAMRHTQGISKHITGLCTADDEEVVLPPVILPPAVVFFPDVAFCANADIAVKFSAAIILAANTAATIKPPNLRVSCIKCCVWSILYMD